MFGGQGEGTELAFGRTDLAGFGKPVALQHDGFAGAGPDDEHIHGPTETADDTTVKPNRFSEPFSQHPKLFDARQRRISVHFSGYSGAFRPVLTKPVAVPILSSRMRGMIEPRTPIIIL